VSGVNAIGVVICGRAIEKEAETQLLIINQNEKSHPNTYDGVFGFAPNFVFVENKFSTSTYKKQE
jgi:hypothetical protein